MQNWSRRTKLHALDNARIIESYNYKYKSQCEEKEAILKTTDFFYREH